MPAPRHLRTIAIDDAGQPERPQYLEDESGCVARIKQGDAAAFELIFRAYYHPLRGFLVRIVERQAIADELAQDVLVALWEGRARLNIAGDLRSYLFRAAHNRAVSHLRHERVVSQGEGVALRNEITPGLGEWAHGTNVLAERRDLVAALRRAVDRLPPRVREAYLLRWVHGLSRQEMARTMGISVKGAEIQLTRAIKALKAALADYL
jgi:RNA polymerase sigma-70 factor (ECF subfamily)